MPITVFGIRHHGPGSSRSLIAALENLKPDVVLVEGPPDAAGVLALAGKATMHPPVALLIYRPEEPGQAVFYPFTIFSPEWQAIQYGLRKNVPVRFMDLPQAVQLAQRAAFAEEMAKKVEAGEELALPAAEEKTAEVEVQQDPLGYLARAAGFEDGERWWEYLVEGRKENREGIFEAVLEMMTALREERDASGEVPPQVEQQREASMRQIIREAEKDGFENIAVVCGAWHGPALVKMPPKKADADLLKGLPKVKVGATWIPWTNDRLATSSGYGAGVRSPGWYAHLWENPEDAVVQWMARAARLLRGEDLEASAAHVIEAVRLAEALAMMRGKPMPGLDELNEASRSVFCYGSDLPMRIIARRLVVGEVLGTVPDETPLMPFHQDLQRLQDQLRLKPEAVARTLDLDLRNSKNTLDLDRSHLLHRLTLLEIPWGKLQPTYGKGTFREVWSLEWKPELAVAVMEAARWGNTVEDAATQWARAEAKQAHSLDNLTELIDLAILADLDAVTGDLVKRLQSLSALSSDVGELMASLPGLVGVMRYGNVRKSDVEQISPVVDGLVTRICVGLSPACAGLADEAARDMFSAVNNTDRAIRLLARDEHTSDWTESIRKVAEFCNTPLLQGRAVRILLDNKDDRPDDTARRMSLALSRGTAPEVAGAWVEGFLHGSGLLLVYDETLWGLINGWLAGVTNEAFIQLLPLLRRTFSTFPTGERKQISMKFGHRQTSAQAGVTYDTGQVEQMLPLLEKLLGLNEEKSVSDGQ